MGVWSDRARRVINETLDSVPADATEVEVKRILREAYPFGNRQHYHKLHPMQMSNAWHHV